ncbi:hypothetical protein Holit_00189 [Hollandina sp. SP2]
MAKYKKYGSEQAVKNGIERENSDSTVKNAGAIIGKGTTA